ncbi:09217496-9def-4243-8a04-ffd2cb4f1b41 [Thermothielavioides terrestris]|uniref:09217496-9def-4243-8a04-ffd2cb4f1b41 n=1 Tax=Thermothielavioides terrestris TaxID=2587410 RepID=A0A446BJR2_9PEZI|nr:09217496-9def-4243-8a04-ffd2cb4f1b41 [Thermothielavioides terrestris]
MSDEVSDFLRSVELLKERRDEEDQARSRELEEKILQEKRERQARREERARSISPQKSSPANTPPPTAHRIGILPSAADGTSLESPGLDSSGSPRQRAADLPSETVDVAADFSTSPTKENDSPFDSDTKRTSITSTSPSIGMPSARSPLSWQRRPTSQSSDRPKSRPLSMIAAENAARSSPIVAESTPATEETLSRDQIAQALAKKDPSWFRQTADPGRGSGAFRKNQVEDQDTVDLPLMRTQLPGLSRELTAETQKDENAARPVTPTAQSGKIGSPLPVTGAQRLDPPVGDGAEETDTASINRQSLASSAGRTSPTRPVSPTKGLGGFVQSAMMKRSDSVKRWSVNSPVGLQRADSIRPGGVTSADGAPRPSTPKASVRPKSMLREASESPAPLPASNEEKEVKAENQNGVAGSATPTEPRTKGEENTTPPTSPSKTMDPRRWSPTKSSSWLETALNKPESPKAKPTPPAPAQPAWLVELNKAKAQRATADLARSAPQPKKPEVKTGGLMRSTPMGASLKPSALASFPPVPPVSGSTSAEKPAIAELRGSLRKTSPTADGSAESKADTNVAAGDKPEAPPKKDFGGNLKPRVLSPEAKSSGSADELKTVLGSLRRTKTQNYVAPDEFKDNILRGKAALNITGGPKKTERKDEFKEAILKKKEDFKKAQQEGRGVTREPSSASEKPVPEGIAKKLELQRTGTLSKQTSTTPDSPLESPALQKRAEAPSRIQNRAGGLAERFNPALASLIARGPPPATGSAKNSGASSASGAPPETGEPAPGPQLTHLTKNRARGPKRKAPTSVAAPAEGAKGSVAEAVSRPEKQPVPTPIPEQLVSLPKPEQPAISSKPEKPAVSPKPEKFAPPGPEVDTPAESKKPLVHDKPKPLGDVIALIDSSKRMSKEESVSVGQPITLIGSTPVKTRPRSPTKVHEQVAALAALSQQSPKPAEPSGEASQPSSPKKLDIKRMSKFLDDQNPASPKPEPVKSRPSSPVKDRFPALAAAPAEKLPENGQVEPKPALPIRSGATPPAGTGSSLTQPAAAPKPAVAVEKPVEAAEAPQAPQESRRLPAPPPVATLPVASPRIPSPVRSPSKQSSDVSALITEFFGPDRPRRKYTADAAEILMRRPASTAKVQTQRAQLVQLTAEGKKIPVPSHYERVLFEREMYVCPHTYIDSAGKKVNEVYFWAGDEVPESVVQDAHLFAAREARAFGGRLVKLSQGKETSEFLQALGGVVIVRRGSSNKYDSLAPNMLCGRRYLGQVVFDEVDFSPLSLCSGFPYLITQQGKCYLWKGKGSDVEELGCARLVGMDLALMGELIEIEEGSEPDSFWAVLGGGTRPSSADHWRLKPSYDKYCSRLFCAHAADKQQITELSPFRQTDLLPSHIYVLDAFFELYIIVGARSQDQYAAFANALDFAQEYAILAAGMEDRPFVPISTVVLEGAPRDLKSVFRKWTDAACPTVLRVSPPPTQGTGSGLAGSGPLQPQQQQQSPLKRARSLRIVPLTQALQALAE